MTTNKDDSPDDAIKKPKRKYPGFRKNVHAYFAQYTDYSGMHGFKYMGEHDRSIFEKLIWTILFVVSLYFCVYLIMETYKKWEQSPVLVSFAQSPTPVWEVPFPAITICPETKTRQRQFNFTQYYHNIVTKQEDNINVTAQDLKRFSDVALLCDNHLYHEGNLTTDLSAIDDFVKIAPQFDELFWQCKWQNTNLTCDQFFTPTLTEDGICFTFNMLDRKELFTNRVFFPGGYMDQGRESEGWSLERGYPRNIGADTFPRRASSSGSAAGLFLLLRVYEQDLDYTCRGPVQGFKVLFHHPAEVPRVRTQYFRAPLNQEIVVAVKPDMITTSDGLKGYDPHRRQCYFPTERQMMFYLSYTQENCQVECLTNYTMQRCGCVAFYMPHDESTPICGSGSIECMAIAEKELIAREVESGISRADAANAAETVDCDCLPSCTSITYNAESSQADFAWEKLFKAFYVNETEFPGVQMTRVTIFFKTMQFIRSERNELYGQTDFLANCGGLLGLFTGFSFLSIAEIIHFFTLRLFCNIRKYGRHYWSGSERLLTDDAYVHKEV